MSSEIFRFANIRPTEPESKEKGNDTIDSGFQLFSSDNPSEFFQELINEGPTRKDLDSIAFNYLSNKEFVFGTNSNPLPMKILDFEAWFSKQESSSHSLEAIKNKLLQLTGMDIPTLMNSNIFLDTKKRLADSLLALLISQGNFDNKKSVLIRLNRLIAVIERITIWPNYLSDDQILDISLLLPPQIFPLPPERNSEEINVEKKIEEQRKKIIEEVDRTKNRINHINRYKITLDELQKAHRFDVIDIKKSQKPDDNKILFSKVNDATADSKETFSNISNVAVTHIGNAGYPIISKKQFESMSNESRETIKQLRVEENFVDLIETTNLVEQEIARESAALYKNKAIRGIVLVGNAWVPVFEPHIPDGMKEPGPCYSMVIDPETPDTTTVPGSASSSLVPIGITELLQVRQKIKYYEAGEVAHITNVMSGESQERSVRELSKTTEIIESESELTSEESRESHTTDRFELQKEANSVIKEDTSREIGISISASYGPVLDGTINTKFSSSRSREKSDKNSARYSREISDRALKKVQQRILEKRSVTHQTEFEVINKHGFTGGPEHVQGIYRWVDKVYEAQIVSYGCRMMFEFIVPEPATFYKFAMGAAPKEGALLEKPEPPGYCLKSDGKFVSLNPSDLDESNYLFWVSRYEVKDAKSPPPRYKLVGVGTANKATSSADTIMSNSTIQLEIPTGYLARQTWVTGYVGWTANGGMMDFVVGRTYMHVAMAGNIVGAAMNGEEGALPVVGFGYHVGFYAATIEVLCERSKECFDAWQIETYNAIMNSYNERKSKYDSELDKAKVTALNMVVGRNPLLNREIERTELKRASISIITGQHFDDFDSIRKLPNGWPQFDTTEARAEAGYIQFFEQAFEWINMTYRFYPYFWGRKYEWPGMLNSEDVDPLFTKFLQAGAARVQVPARPGFENAIANYFLGMRPWEDETAFEVDGSLYSSIIDEIKEDLRGSFTKGVGTVTVVKDSPRVIGIDTQFDKKLHTSRDLYIQDKIHVIKEVISHNEIILETPYTGESEDGISYSFGARAVGDPWEVRVPTTLLYLQNEDELPKWI